MKGWRLTFNFRGGGTVIDLEYVGSRQAIQVGLGLTALMLGEQLQRRFGAEHLPDGFVEEALLLSGIKSGGPMTEYKGKFLRVEPVPKASGLSASVHIEWGD